MKQQQTILKTYKNGVQTGFERFTCKKPETVLNQYRKISYLMDSFLYKEYREADIIKIISTPNGVDEAETLAEYTPEEFFKKIS